MEVEVFAKQPLPPSRTDKDSRGKLRRKEVTVRQRCLAGEKAKKQAAIGIQVKTKEQLLASCNSENDSSVIVRHQKVGIYGKGKASETVTRRRALSDITVSNHAASCRDLKRMLESRTKYPRVARSSDGRKHTSPSLSHKTATTASPSSQPQQSCMEEGSPKSSPSHGPCVVPMLEIAEALVSSLDVTSFFPGTKYLRTTKRDLRKIMKQSDPKSYSHLMRCMSENSKQTTPPPPPPPPLPTPPVESKPHPPEDMSLGLTSLVCQPTDPAHLTSDPTHLTSDPTILTSDPMLGSLALLFGNGSDNALSHPPSLDPFFAGGRDPILDDPSHPPPSHFQPSHPPTVTLDILDLLEPVPADIPPPPSAVVHWMPSPDRPRMYPRKLY